MKKTTSSVTAVLLAVTLCAGAFTAVGILLLPATLYAAPMPADEEATGVPYAGKAESSGLLLLLDDGEGAFVFLDFEQEVALIKLFERDAAKQADALGYEIDYTLCTNLDFVGKMCDRMGGIVLEKEGRQVRYSAAGLLQELSEQNSREIVVKICEAFFEKIARTGLSSGDFKFIIENTENDLNYPTCYAWIERMPTLFSRYVFLE